MASNSSKESKMPPFLPITPFEGLSPQIDATVFLDPTARLIGDVVLGPEVSIWPLAVLRADGNRIQIGKRSALLDKVLIEAPKGHPVIVEERVLVSHGAILHGCTVREGAIIGIGAIVLDGAEVGKDAVVGSGSVVPPGMKIPEARLVLGIPAKVVRNLSPEELQRFKEQVVEAYEKSRKYLEAFGPRRQHD